MALYNYLISNWPAPGPAGWRVRTGVGFVVREFDPAKRVAVLRHEGRDGVPVCLIKSEAYLMQNRRYRVLVVEDEETDYNQIRGLFALSTLKVDLAWAFTYYDGLEELGRGEYDVCLVDHDLDGFRGIDLLKEAAEMDCSASFVFLLDEEDSPLSQDALGAGAADYLVKKQIGPQLLARVVRYAVEKAEMAEALRELAVRDELTGLYNRREMRRILSEEVPRSLRYHCPLSLILVEIDGFRETNERFGLSVGDAVLQWVAQLLRDSVRSTDRPARHGRESIVIILPETGKAQAYRAAERLRKAVASKKIPVAGMDRSPMELAVTISLGVASLPDDADSEDGLVSAASQALHEAVRMGRNHTVQSTNTNHSKEIGHLVG